MGRDSASCSESRPDGTRQQALLAPCRRVVCMLFTRSGAASPLDRPVAEIGVFPCHSVHLRRSEVPGTLVGRPISICAPEEIHGKTGSAPSGAVLFGPFSANKKKDKGIGDVGGRWNFNLMLSRPGRCDGAKPVRYQAIQSRSLFQVLYHVRFRYSKQCPQDPIFCTSARCKSVSAIGITKNSSFVAILLY